ncbi:MAG TPA: molybdopterin cofactor-binding domain-containing protein, partial [Burkholderiales bacterium]|nr:molybdopterin cofactor-binding domain-containing protein [Burkholderiales bacterium]
MSTIENLSRRTFLKGTAALGGGFALGLILDPFRPHPFYGGFIGSAEAADAAPPPTGTLSPNVFVSIDNTGTVTIVAHRSEMGQGVRTSLPTILADELEADWGRVRIEQAVGDKIYGSQYTDGSRSVRHNYERMREFGAVARTMLVQAAAIQWGVPAAECKAQNHRVVHAPSGKSLDYGQLVDTAATLAVPGARQVTLKDPKDFRHIGKPLPSVDLPDMLAGKAVYGIDIRLPGMLYAVVEHCPVTYGKVKSFDASEALKVAGVKK